MWKTRKSVRLTHHFREEFIIVKMAIREKFTRLKKIFTPVPVGWVGGLVGGRVRKAKNKAKAQHSWGLGLAELGRNMSQQIDKILFHMMKIFFTIFCKVGNSVKEPGNFATS